MFSFKSDSDTGISKHLIKLSAYESLLDAQIGTLPVDLFEVFRNRSGVHLYGSRIFRVFDG